CACSLLFGRHARPRDWRYIEVAKFFHVQGDDFSSAPPFHLECPESVHSGHIERAHAVETIRQAVVIAKRDMVKASRSLNSVSKIDRVVPLDAFDAVEDHLLSGCWLAGSL